MSELAEVNANINSLNADAQQFATDVQSAVTGPEFTDVIEGCDRAQKLADELQSVLGQLAIDTRTLNDRLGPFSDGNERLNALVERAQALTQSSTLQIAASVSYLNAGVPELLENLASLASDAETRAAVVDNLNKELGMHTGGIKYWSGQTIEVVGQRASLIEEKVTDWKRMH